MLNQITIQGRLVRDIELRRTQSNTAVAGFTLAVDDDFKNAQGEKTTQFIDCVVWRAQAELIAKYVQKGQMLIVTGRLQFRDWEDKNAQKHRSAEILVSSFWFCGGKENSTQRNERPVSAAQGVPTQNFDVIEDNTELLPF